MSSYRKRNEQRELASKKKQFRISSFLSDEATGDDLLEDISTVNMDVIRSDYELEENYIDIVENDYEEIFEEIEDNNETNNTFINQIALYKNSRISLQEFAGRFFMIKKIGSISDVQSKLILELFQLTAPYNSAYPKTLEGLRKVMHQFLPNYSKSLVDAKIEMNLNSGILIFPFNLHIKRVILENLAYFLPENYENEIIPIDIYLHIDGAQINKSNTLKMWPVTGIFPTLPKKIRYSLRNNIFFSVTVTKDNVDFKYIIENIKNEAIVKSFQSVLYGDEKKPFYFLIKFKALLGDIPAIRESNGFTACNSFFSCTFCDIPGESVQMRRVWLGEHNLITDQSYIENAKEAEKQKLLNNTSHYKGIKHLSFWNPLLSIPSGLSIDWMHTLLLGPIKDNLTLFLKKNFNISDNRTTTRISKVDGLSEKEIESINNILVDIKLGNEFSRSFKKLSELKYFKAIEYKILFLYGYPTVLLNESSKVVRDLVLLDCILLGGISMLFKESISDEEEITSYNLIKYWHSRRIKILGAIAGSIKCHLCLHLPMICKRLGNIVDFSCFHGEGVLHCLTKMINQRDFKSTLSQIKLRVSDYILSDKICSFFDDKVEELSNIISEETKNDAKTQSIDLESFVSVLCLSHFSFTLKASRNQVVDKDSLVIFKVHNNVGEYQSGLIIDIFKNTETKDVIFAIKPFLDSNSSIFNTVDKCNLMDLHKLKSIPIFRRFRRILHPLVYKASVNNQLPILFIQKSDIISKALYINCKKYHFVVPYMNTFEHN
uniref:Dimer_Tnp_hAT domain-containing protein n=1 Tax=Strongyloides stercoralis TaxID=6248 RepID=A0A0K0EHA4_STRER